MAKLGIEAMKAIGHALRVLYADIVAEGVPERFAAILRRLDEPAEAGSTDEPTPPPQHSPKDEPSSTREHARRDDAFDRGENHEILGRFKRRALRWFARGALYDPPMPTRLAAA